MLAERLALELYPENWTFNPELEDVIVLESPSPSMHELSLELRSTSNNHCNEIVLTDSESQPELEAIHAKDLPYEFDMEELPTELRRAILSFVDLDTLKNFRLTSKLWAALGEDLLISKTFLSLSYRDDASRLLAIAEHPRLGQKIQKIRFLHGEVDEYYARHNTYFLNYMQDPDVRTDTQTATWTTTGELKALQHLHLHKACGEQVMQTVFGLLTNLQSVEVSLMNYPFPDDESHEAQKQIWSIPSTRILPRVATTERFTNVVSAVATNKSALSIKTISHDRLPFEFFAQKPVLISHLTEAFRSLTNLDLGLDYSVMPNALHQIQAFDNLYICIHAATHLRSLRLEFLGEKKIDIAELLISFAATDYVFTNLEDLALYGVSSRERELGDFLVRQNATLKTLRLGNLGMKNKHQAPNGGVHLREGSFQSLFERVRQKMELDRFLLRGDLVGIESGERWILEDEVDEKDLWEFVTD